MEKCSYYYKVLNDELFGGEGSEGYMALSLTDKNNNPIKIIEGSFSSNSVKYIEISKEEYLSATEDN